MHRGNVGSPADEPKNRAPQRCEALYRRNWGLVRGALAARGVAPADLDDLTHEVFLVAMRKLGEVALDEAAEGLWLGQIAHYVAAGHRRRAFRRREIGGQEHADFPDAAGPSDALLDAETSNQLHLALSRIAPRERDLLALHLIGDLSFRTLGEISDCDPKTARTHFLRAMRQLRLRLEEELPPLSSPASTPAAVPLTPEHDGAAAPRLELLALDDHLAIGLAGHVCITHWYGTVGSSSLDMFLEVAREVKCRGIRGYLAVVADRCQTPGFAARGQLSDLLTLFRSELKAYVTVSDAHRFVYPIMKALAALARIPFPMRFVRTLEEGAEWLFGVLGTASGLPSADSLLQAARELGTTGK